MGSRSEFISLKKCVCWREVYIKSICPHCGQSQIKNVSLELTETKDKHGDSELKLEDVVVNEVVLEADFLRLISDSLKKNVKPDISDLELHKILNQQYGIAAGYCFDIIEKLKCELKIDAKAVSCMSLGLLGLYNLSPK